MIRQLKLLHRLSSHVIQKAGYQNYVISDSFAQMEAECEKCCYTPRVGFEPRKVCVCGAGSDIGQVVSLVLKQEPVVKTLALYDDIPERNVLGTATDLAHIDTSTEVEAYQGKAFLKDALHVAINPFYYDIPERIYDYQPVPTPAPSSRPNRGKRENLHDSDVVLICGGCYELPPCCLESDRELFFKNMQFVRTTTMAVAMFCPYTILAVQTPPVDANYALCAHTLATLKKYDRRRVLGVNSVNAMRANQLYASMMGDDPSKSKIAVVGGTSRCTRVPVFSKAVPNPSDCNIPQKHLSCLCRLVREADEIICRVKRNNEQGHLSIGFSTGRFVANIMKGMFLSPTTLDSAMVEQPDPEKCYGMKVCATGVTIGRAGIEGYIIPTLSSAERRLLKDARCDIEDMYNLGRCCALGDEYSVHPCKVPIKCPPRPDCPCPNPKCS